MGISYNTDIILGVQIDDDELDDVIIEYNKSIDDNDFGDDDITEIWEYFENVLDEKLKAINLESTQGYIHEYQSFFINIPFDDINKALYLSNEELLFYKNKIENFCKENNLKILNDFGLHSVMYIG